MNFSDEEEETVWKIVSSILHLGNLEINDSTYQTCIIFIILLLTILSW